jgi:hypothetical protein
MSKSFLPVVKASGNRCNSPPQYKSLIRAYAATPARAGWPGAVIVAAALFWLLFWASKKVTIESMRLCPVIPAFAGVITCRVSTPYILRLNLV